MKVLFDLSFQLTEVHGRTCKFYAFLCSVLFCLFLFSAVILDILFFLYVGNTNWLGSSKYQS